jgi:hypothetical protein
MNSTQIRELTFEGFQLELEIRTRTTRLNEIKKALITEAASRPQEHAALEDSDGTNWKAEAAGCVATVQFPTDQLKEKISSDSTAWKKVLTALDGKDHTALFNRVDAWAPKVNFRALAEDQLTAKDAAKLVKLITTPSTPKVLWKEVA